jgi:hypothetical protein
MRRALMVFGLVPIVGLAMMGSMAGPAAAAAGRTPFSVDIQVTLGVAQSQWTSGNITHIRGQAYTVTPDPVSIAGVDVSITGVANFDVDMAKGQGTDFGTVLLSATDGSGSWVGRFSGTLTDGLLLNSFVAQGTGSLSGTTVQGTYDEYAPLEAVFSGEVLTH